MRMSVPVAIWIIAKDEKLEFVGEKAEHLILYSISSQTPWLRLVKNIQGCLTTVSYIIHLVCMSTFAHTAILAMPLRPKINQVVIFALRGGGHLLVISEQLRLTTFPCLPVCLWILAPLITLPHWFIVTSACWYQHACFSVFIADTLPASYPYMYSYHPACFLPLHDSCQIDFFFHPIV